MLLVRFQVLTAASMKITVVWGNTFRSLKKLPEVSKLLIASIIRAMTDIVMTETVNISES
jgi:hypothetical protein